MADPRTRGGRLGTVRIRATAAAVVLVGVALLIGGTGLTVLLRRSLTDQVRDAAQLRADDAADALATGTPPEQVARGDDEVIIQIVAPDGRVLAATANVAGTEPVRDPTPGGTTEVTAGPTGDTDRFLVVARAARSPGTDVVVLVGRALDPVGESSGVVVGLLAIGLPVLLVVVGTTTWWVAGRVLARVEAVRAEVEEISASELYRRVPVPSDRDEIGRLAATMNQMLARLQHAQTEQRRFVSDASHEMRSPVAAIRQHAEVAVSYPDTMTGPELGATVLEETLRVQRLVEDLLLLARADEGGLRSRTAALDLDDLALDEARRAQETSGLVVNTTGVSAARVRGDPAQLARAVRNIVDNAVRHAASTVALGVEEREEEAVLWVDDDGPGIAPPDRRRVLERFVRLDDARARDGGGTGLGLAIVAEVVVAHGGTVGVSDAEMGGAHIEVRLPRGGGPPPPAGRRGDP